MSTTSRIPTPIQEEMPLEHLQLVGKVQRVLEGSGYPELQWISVKVHQSEVFLHGRVSSYFQKQLAQELVKRIPGIFALRNEILVAPKQGYVFKNRR